MPYLDHDWIIAGQTQQMGTWVPERNWIEWQKRELGLNDAERSLVTWRKRPSGKTASGDSASGDATNGDATNGDATNGDATNGDATNGDATNGDATRPDLDAWMSVLACDMASAQRDGFFYVNFLEQLKDDPSATAGDEVVRRMQALGFASVGWPPLVGGPPAPESSRPVRKVMDWLLELVAKVMQFLLECVGSAVKALSPLGVSAVALDVSLPPSVSFEFSCESVEAANWDRVRRFFADFVSEFQEKVFES